MLKAAFGYEAQRAVAVNLASDASDLVQEERAALGGAEVPVLACSAPVKTTNERALGLVRGRLAASERSEADGHRITRSRLNFDRVGAVALVVGHDCDAGLSWSRRAVTVSDGPPLALFGVFDVIVGERDSGGNHLWSRVYGTTSWEYAGLTSLACGTAGICTLTGNYDQTSIDFGGIASSPLPVANWAGIFLARFAP